MLMLAQIKQDAGGDAAGRSQAAHQQPGGRGARGQAQAPDQAAGRDRAAHQRGKRAARRSATSARPRARRCTRSTTTRCAARSRTRGTHNFPEVAGTQAVWRADDDRHRQLRRQGAGHRSGRDLGQPGAGPARRDHRPQRRARSAASATPCAARPTRSWWCRASSSPATKRWKPSSPTVMNAVDRYCVMGNPVEHSKSPWIHARFAAAHRRDLDYGKRLMPLGRFRRGPCTRSAPKAAAAATSPCRSSSRRRRWPRRRSARARSWPRPATSCASMADDDLRRQHRRHRPGERHRSATPAWRSPGATCC